jgi:predicted Rossmann-fold nucleotide-binding protein
MPILLFGRDYWQRLINFDLLLEEGMLAEEDLKHIQYVEDVQEAWAIIENSMV